MQPFTWNADREQLATNQFRMRVSSRWRNYLNPNGWKRIDLTPACDSGRFSVSQAPYSIDLPKRAHEWSVFQSTNRYDVHTKRVINDAAVGIQKRYITAESVRGIAIAEGIAYPNAFPQLNAGRLVRPRSQDLQDLVVFHAEPPGIEDVLVPIEIDYGTLPLLVNQQGGLSFQDGDGPRGVVIKPLRVWDSAGRSLEIQLRGRIEGSRFVGSKVIPRAFFKNAVYPVYADTTTSFYPNPGTTVDGSVLRSSSNLTWSDVRTGAGTNALDNSTSTFVCRVHSDSSSNRYSTMGRGIFLFDTSSLDDSAVIISASLNLKPAVITDNFNLSLCVVSSNPASNTALANADYGNLGSTRYSTSDDDLGNYSAGSYRAIALNSSGLSAISKTGVSKYGTRSVSDVDNVEVTWVASTNGQMSVYNADQTGTGDDPYLEVVYSSATFTAAAGSFTLTGIASTLSYGRKITAAPASFTLTGVDATISTTGKVLVASPAVFTLTGGTALLVKGPFLVCAKAAFTFTGTAISFTIARKIVAVYGIYELFGGLVTFVKNRSFTAASAAFTLSGTAVTFVYTSKIIHTPPRVFMLEGKAVTMRWDHYLTATGAAFTLTGTTTPLNYGKTITGDRATFTLTGTAVSLKYGYRLIHTPVRAFTLTGIATTLTNARRVTGAAASFTLTGTAAGLARGLKLVSAAALFTQTGIAAGVLTTRLITPAVGSYALTGSAVLMPRSYPPITIVPASFTLTGTAAGLRNQRKVVASGSAFVLTGVTVGLTSARRVTATGTTYTLTGIAAGVTHQFKITGGVATYTLTGKSTGLYLTGRPVVAVRGELSSMMRVRGRLEANP